MVPDITVKQTSESSVIIFTNVPCMYTYKTTVSVWYVNVCKKDNLRCINLH